MLSSSSDHFHDQTFHGSFTNYSFSLYILTRHKGCLKVYPTRSGLRKAGVHIFLEKLGIVIGREDMSREAIPKRIEVGPAVSCRATELRSYNARVCFGRLTAAANRIVDIWNNT